MPSRVIIVITSIAPAAVDRIGCDPFAHLKFVQVPIVKFPPDPCVICRIYVVPAIAFEIVSVSLVPARVRVAIDADDTSQEIVPLFPASVRALTT